jgi:predicted nucleic acid-binding protein
MNVVDSCGWLEYFADGPNASFFAPAIEDVPNLVVPTISLYEVFRRVREQRGETDALQAVALMQQGTLADLTATVAVAAASLSHSHKLPMADSIMLATARAYQCVLLTQDQHLAAIEDVRYIEKA